MNDWQNRSISKTLDEKTIKYVIDRVEKSMVKVDTSYYPYEDTVLTYDDWHYLKEELLNETGD